MRRADKKLAARGKYSWTTGIRACVRIAHAMAKSEAEFRSPLSSMDVIVDAGNPHKEHSRTKWGERCRHAVSGSFVPVAIPLETRMDRTF